MSPPRRPQKLASVSNILGGPLVRPVNRVELAGGLVALAFALVLLLRWVFPMTLTTPPPLAELTARVEILESRYGDIPNIKEAAATALQKTAKIEQEKLAVRVKVLEDANAARAGTKTR